MLNSHEPNVLFRSDTIVRNEMLVGLRVRGLKTLSFEKHMPVFSKVKQHSGKNKCACAASVGLLE